jgi:hypothetical protein
MKLKKKIKAQLYYAGAILFVLLLLMLTLDVPAVLMSTFIFIVACISKFYKRFTSATLGPELVTPAAIIFAYAYGPLVCLLSAFVMLIISGFLSGKLDGLATLNEMIAYSEIAVIILLFGGMFSFVPLAVFLAVLRSISIFIFAVFFVGKNPVQFTMIVVTNVILNVFVLYAFGDFLIAPLI